ncbi:MAG: hypothetical protein V4535_04210, partial [Bacteroidota bacterium]
IDDEHIRPFAKAVDRAHMGSFLYGYVKNSNGITYDWGRFIDISELNYGNLCRANLFRKTVIFAFISLNYL